MKRVRYSGESSVNLGRFGQIEKGATLNVRESEWAMLQTDERFELLDRGPSKGDQELFAAIKPLGTPVYDLRTVPWEKPTLAREMTARYSKGKVIRILDAMRLVGVEFEESYDRHLQRVDLVDLVIEKALLYDWARLGRHERGLLAVWTSSSAYVPEKEDSEELPPAPKKAPAKRKRTKAATVAV